MNRKFSAEALNELLKEGLDLSDDLKNDTPLQFQVGYQDWYSRALSAIRELLPERLQEFERHYENSARASLQIDNYSIQDFLLGLTIIRGNKPFDGKGIARSRILQQIGILGSAKSRLDVGEDGGVMTQPNAWTEILANPDAKRITAEITHRFLQSHVGTPLHEAKAQLGTKRGLLDELVRQQIIQIKGQWYFPCFLALEAEAADLRNRASTFTTLVLKALKSLYERTGKWDYSASEVLTMVNETPTDVSGQNVLAGMLLAADFPTFVNGLDFSADGAVSRITILEGILDFGSIDSAWDKELARRKSIHQEGSPPVATSLQKQSSLPELPSRGRKVFVIHGRDERLRKGMFDFLRAIGLDPLEWSQALTLTGKATPYIGEILDAAFSQAQAVVVLLTPDDEVRLRSDLIRPNDPPDERNLRRQARPNVLFEAGMAFATHSNATVLVRIGDIKPFSDVGGRHVVNMDNSIQKRQELGQKLRTAGCSVNTEGTDWHTAGDLTPPVPQAANDETKNHPNGAPAQPRYSTELRNKVEDGLKQLDEAEKEALRQLLLEGQMTDSRAVSLVARKGKPLGGRLGVFQRIESATGFVKRSGPFHAGDPLVGYRGGWRINPSFRDLLEESLSPGE